MLGKSVIFDGVALPGAKIIHTDVALVKFVAGPGQDPPQPTLRFHIQAEGLSRSWSTSTTQGFWRSFCEAVDDRARAEAFVRRYGDPSGRLAADGETYCDDWFGLSCSLAMLGRAWGPADADGISRIVDDPEHLGDAVAWLRFSGLKDFAGEFTLIPDPTGAPDWALQAKTLGAFMFASAVSGLQRRVAMRRCRVCTTWFEAGRVDALYCSNTCRSTASHNRREDEASALARAADPAGPRRKQAEREAALTSFVDPAGHRRRQKEVEMVIKRDVARIADKKKD